MHHFDAEAGAVPHFDFFLVRYISRKLLCVNFL
jgi:hypothetical protein